ncbi:unnamed protein product [Ambrosiozyma monospora]|uniref:Unnamed protein product n=1 Tax=Ambrosiozyma monospora TaxID=43982 RepID=A0ACB5TBP2_AMBMO|nr:unnamed protein product [Ambrosiozyma monospora]
MQVGDLIPTTNPNEQVLDVLELSDTPPSSNEDENTSVPLGMDTSTTSLHKRARSSESGAMTVHNNKSQKLNSFHPDVIILSSDSEDEFDTSFIRIRKPTNQLVKSSNELVVKPSSQLANSSNELVKSSNELVDQQ